MEPMELLEKVKNRDEDAFYVLVHKYGKTIYTRLLSQLGDKSLADEAFRKTIVDFYELICRDDSSDPVESILLDSADKVQQQVLSESVENAIARTAESFADFYRPEPETSAVKEPKKVQPVAAPTVGKTAAPAPEEVPPTKNKKKKGFFVFCMILLALAILALVWVIVGELMICGKLPYMNIGYESFIGVIQNWLMSPRQAL